MIHIMHSVKSKTLITHLLTIVVLLYSSQSKLSFDFIIPYNTSVFQCIHNSGFSLVTLRAAFRQGLDPNGVQNLNNAKNAGLQTDIVIVPCRNRTPADLVHQITTKVSKQLYTKIWIQADTVTGDKNCLWTNYNKDQNCQYLKSLIDQFKKYGSNPGVQGQNDIWINLFGSEKACQLPSSIPLWWIGPDGRTNFDNYQPMGGWSAPTRKQFKQQAISCGVTMNMNYQ